MRNKRFILFLFFVSIILENRLLQYGGRGPQVQVLGYMPMQLVAPSAVSIADAIEAISCTINLAVSFFVIMVRF